MSKLGYRFKIPNTRTQSQSNFVERSEYVDDIIMDVDHLYNDPIGTSISRQSTLFENMVYGKRKDVVTALVVEHPVIKSADQLVGYPAFEVIIDFPEEENDPRQINRFLECTVAVQPEDSIVQETREINYVQLGPESDFSLPMTSDVNSKELSQLYTKVIVPYDAHQGSESSFLSPKLGDLLLIGYFPNTERRRGEVYQIVESAKETLANDKSNIRSAMTAPASFNLKRAPVKLGEADQGLIRKWAELNNVEPNLIIAVIEVESGGRAFVNNRPVIRVEVHKLRKFVKPSERARLDEVFGATSENSYKGHTFNGAPLHGQGNETLATSQVREYEALSVASSIMDEERARLGTSTGLGQIMGFNFAKAGYKSATEMFKSFEESKANQISGMLTFIEKDKNGRGLRALQNNDIVEFVKFYNGDGDNVPKYVNKILSKFQG